MADQVLISIDLLLALPQELFSHIFSLLDPLDLASVAATCRALSGHAKSDTYWVRHVQDNIPGLQLSSPSPCNSYRELYISHDPRWFLTKYKFWFSNHDLPGKLIICRYNPNQGCIEGYRLLARRSPQADDGVDPSFNPRCYLHLDNPTLQLDIVGPKSPAESSETPTAAHRFNDEVFMPIIKENESGLFSNFLLARSVDSRPTSYTWPPPAIPARSRVYVFREETYVDAKYKPQKRSQILDQAFRIRQTVGRTPISGVRDVRPPEDVHTYATLDPKVYTPTEDKPYRGIWVGDYGPHGCEFLVVHQPDDKEPFDEASVVRGQGETVEKWEARKKEERINRGSLEVIKLTGDPNIPRGECTFIADDISSNGLIRIATEEQFEGARIVKSFCHVANNGFTDDTYIHSQLIIISPNKLAQRFVGQEHITFMYERIDIDQFLSPFNDPPLELDSAAA